MLVLTACGTVVSNPTALSDLQNITERCVRPRPDFNISILTSYHRFRFSDVFAFSEAGLDPQRIVPFINEFALDVLVTGRPTTTALPMILSNTSTGRYTGIVHLTPSTSGVVAEWFEWFHHSQRPNGQKLPIQCPRCRAYRSWVIPSKRPKRYNENLEFRCITKGCTEVCRVRQLKEFIPLPIGLTTGSWFFKKLVKPRSLSVTPHP